jgi:hypothetical protein
MLDDELDDDDDELDDELDESDGSGGMPDDDEDESDGSGGMPDDDEDESDGSGGGHIRCMHTRYSLHVSGFTEYHERQPVGVGTYHRHVPGQSGWSSWYPT